MWYMIGLAVGIVTLTMALVIRDQKRQAHEAAQVAAGMELEEPTPGLWQNYPGKTVLSILVLLITGLILVRAGIAEVPGTVTLFAGLAHLGAWLALAALRAYPPEEAQDGEAVDEGVSYEEDDWDETAPTGFNLCVNTASPLYAGD